MESGHAEFEVIGTEGPPFQLCRNGAFEVEKEFLSHPSFQNCYHAQTFIIIKRRTSPSNLDTSLFGV